VEGGSKLKPETRRLRAVAFLDPGDEAGLMARRTALHRTAT